jgi:hypothetical protein
VQLVATAHGNELANLIKNPTLCDLVGGIQSVTLSDEEARRRRTQKTVLERSSRPTFPLAVEMHSRSLWSVHRDVAATVDLLLRGHPARPQIRELGPDGTLQQREAAPPPSAAGLGPAPRRGGPAPAVAAHRPPPVPLPDPSPKAHEPVAESGCPEPVPTPLRVLGVGLSPGQLREAALSHRDAVTLVSSVEEADAVLSIRGRLGREPALRRTAQERALPILVIKSDSPHQLQRGLDRLLGRYRQSGHPPSPRRPPSGVVERLEDAHAAMEECRLAVEQVVLPRGHPVELLPRSERVRQMQAELVERYKLRSAVFGEGNQQRLRVFPA